MKTVLLVGAGGIGAPCALALAKSQRAAELSILAVDDDVVDRSNLHRQILFADGDVGRPKLAAFADALGAMKTAAAIETIDGRLLPDTAALLSARADVIVDASDNFATRFLAADAAHLVGRPIVHAASVRWSATVLASAASGSPCYRCLFEDVPEGDAPDCATAGVIGPVCGVAGALAADLALRALFGGPSPYGFVLTYDGLRDRLRQVGVRARADCALCGPDATIRGITAEQYQSPACALVAR